MLIIGVIGDEKEDIGLDHHGKENWIATSNWLRLTVAAES